MATAFIVLKRATAIVAVAIAVGGVHAQKEEPGSPRAGAALTILQINDLYSMLPTEGIGGLARVATLKQRVAASGQTPLLVVAGDFLSPSVASSIFKGEQVVAVLNAAGVDLATLGNHEFDFGIDVLLQRMRESRFQYVITNVVDTTTGKPIGGAAPYLVRHFGALKIGFLGLCLTTSEISPHMLDNVRLVDPLEAAGEYVPKLRAEGVDAIVAITHLAFQTDRALAAQFPEIGLIIGGHEHYPITATEGATLISKAGSDARWVARIDVNRRPDARIERFFELIPITGTLADEPKTAAVLASYEDRLGKELDTVVTVSRVPLDAETVRLRASETNLGDLIADAMRAATGADVAIVNSGSIRGDRAYPPGPITRRMLVEMHPFGNVLCEVAVPGRVLLDALNHGVAKLPSAAGQFPQVSGVTFEADARAAPGNRVRSVRVGGQPLDRAKTYSVAMSDYQLKGGDGYEMFKTARVLVGPESGELMVSVLEKYLAGQKEIAPAAAGRIVIAHRNGDGRHYGGVISCATETGGECDTRAVSTTRRK